MEAEVPDFLRSVDFFAAADEELLRRIAHEVEPIELSDGEELFADASSGDAMYFIARGQIDIVKNETVLITRRAGEYVGELALIDDEPRSAGARARGAAALLRWRRSAFLTTLAESGPAAYAVCRAVSAKLRQSVAQVAEYQAAIEQAARVQRALLPSDDITDGPWEIAGRCIQANRVGGDYWDYRSAGEAALTLALADIQGHGVYAGLLVALLKSRFHTPDLAIGRPAEVLKAFDGALRDGLDMFMMATGVAVHLDAVAGALSYASAGHNPLILLRSGDGEIVRLESTGPPLGSPVDARATSTSVPVAAGDLVLLATDGLFEAAGAAGEQLGVEPVAELLRRHRTRTCREIRQAILEQLAEFSSKSAYEDDVTLVVVRCG